MLDFGLAELLVIACVLVFVIGPQDLPGIMKGLGGFVRRLRYMKHAVFMQMDTMMGVVDPHDVNTVMTRNQPPVPEVSPEQEPEWMEDEEYDPRQGMPDPPGETSTPQEQATRLPFHERVARDEAEASDPAIRDQQDLFSSEPGGKA